MGRVWPEVVWGRGPCRGREGKGIPGQGHSKGPQGPSQTTLLPHWPLPTAMVPADAALPSHLSPCCPAEPSAWTPPPLTSPKPFFSSLRALLRCHLRGTSPTLNRTHACPAPFPLLLLWSVFRSVSEPLKNYLITLIILKSSSQLFCKMSLNLDLPDCFLMLRFRLNLGGGAGVLHM